MSHKFTKAECQRGAITTWLEHGDTGHYERIGAMSDPTGEARRRNRAKGRALLAELLAKGKELER